MAATDTLLIVHLSDLHLTSASASEALERAPLIAAAVTGLTIAPCDVLIAFTGDIAFAGKPAEYGVATRFVGELRAKISESPNVASVDVAFAAGNHDCDFSDDGQARQLVIDGLVSTNPVKVDATVVSACTSVQRAFFDFTALSGQVVHDHEKLCSEKILSLAGAHKARVRVLNTAWVSKLHEKQGELFFPFGEISPSTGIALDIVMFHHPLNWLEATNARAVRAQLDRHADIVLTGHEHESGAYERKVLGGGGALYVEGAVLRDSASGRSGFNVLEIDAAAQHIVVHEYDWDGEWYIPTREPKTIRLRGRARGVQLHVSDDFLNDFVFDPGAPFTHPVKGRLTLADIYVAPDLARRTIDEVVRSKKIPSVEAERFCQETRRLLLAGPSDSGKTALAKRIFAAALEAGKFPLWIEGDAIKRSDVRHIASVIQRAVAQQYDSKDAAERFAQLPIENKVLIIDDFSRVKGNRKAHVLVANHLCSLAGQVVLTVDDLYEIERVVDVDASAALSAFTTVDIRDFGYQLRGELIDKWVRLGRELTVSDADLIYEIQKTENVVNTLLGRSLFPPYPLFVLTVLQTVEAMTALKTASVGTYGYVYEALITAKLSNSKQISVDTKYNFLAYIAFAMFESDEQCMNGAKLAAITQQYFEAYRVRLPLESLIAEFIAAGIMLERDGGVTFRYRYVYYYFVGRYLAEGLDDPDAEPRLRASIAQLVSQIYREEHANILLFLLYLSKDRRVLQAMFENASALFADVLPARLEEDVQFVARLDSGKVPLELPAADLASRRKEERARRDSVDDSEAGDDSAFINLNVAMKSIQILGQVLRNFAGSLPGTLKLRIATEVSQLGLRAVASTYRLIEARMTELRQSVRDSLTENDVVPADAVDQKADEFIFQLVVLFGHAIVKRISFAIGSEELVETYNDLREVSDTIAMRLVDASIHLDHFRHISLDDLQKLRRRIEHNSVAVTLLRQLVWDRLYLFPVDFRVRQQLCREFGIVESPKLLAGSAKSFR